jgi:hypothetical protein
MTRAFERCFKYTDTDGQQLVHANTFRREQTTGPERLVCAPANTCLPLVRAFAGTLSPPLYLLFVLTVSRRGREAGRHQSDLLSQAQVSDFLHEFGEFLDRDARQQLWIGIPDGSSLIVWDNHQLVFAYGDLDRFTAAARELGLASGMEEIASPHAHNYHELFDDTEEEILDRFEWHRTPLRDGDD